ncbi:MAG: branched-chain amino acid ABC transporter permease [Deltaproteobacteria bacterium]|nr:MAG: branched-chain amino acid ABC transporter permease [Deltaproteobacteria bacterium]
MRTLTFTGIAVGIALLVATATSVLVENEYFFSASYTVLQFVVLATAWNILGGFTGYVNFGSAAFFALGAYSGIALDKLTSAPLPLVILAGAAVAGLVGLGMGYLTPRLRGVFFAIATISLAEVLFTLVVNWDYVGGARGAYVALAQTPPLGFRSMGRLLFTVMALMAAGAVSIARFVQVSTLGRGLAAIRDDEMAAECSGVPTLRLKLISTTLSGALMGMAGATFPWFLSYVEPHGVFSLSYAVNSIAMPLIGGMYDWAGPVIGALLLGGLQQILQVNVPADWNLFLVGALLVVFVTVAPHGIMGWTRRR